MLKVFAIHSYCGGTGRSSMIANLAAVTASAGHRVAVVDANLQAPSIHVLFGLEPEAMRNTLSNYLLGDCPISDTVYSVAPKVIEQANGAMFMVPSSTKIENIVRILKEGYDVQLLRDGLQDLVKELKLNYIFIDTPSGIHEEALLAIAVSNVLVIVLKPDKQDFQGTAVIADLSRKLRVPKALIVVNRILQSADFQSLSKQVSQSYGLPVAGLFPNCEEMIELGSDGLFCFRYPDHPLSKLFQNLAAQLML